MITADELFKHYSDHGFSFSKEILSRYTLSLYTKPFVILSGISGTGKTKIAQLFPIEHLTADAVPAPTTRHESKGRITLTITKGVRDTDGRGNLANDHMSVVFEPDKLKEIERRIADLVKAGRDDNVVDPVELTVDTPQGEELTFGVYVQRANSPLIRLRAKSKRGESPSYDSQPYLRKHYSVGDIVALEKIGPYHFKIVAATEEQKKQEAVDQAKIASTIRRTLLVPVRSDWTDQSEVFGYYDPISQRYSVTSVLEFLLDAQQFPNEPFHLILDEMNLSKVEYYFSDFLSCLESRICKPDGSVEQVPIRLHNQGSVVPTTHVNIEEVPESIELPSNLYVTGTVNVDETTYMFSPKVLDRSNVIEFNEVNLEGSASSNEDRFTLKTLPEFKDHDPVSSDDFHHMISEAMRQKIAALNKCLDGRGHNFGYRTAFEMARFIDKATTYAEAVAEVAFDIQITQKVLPKLHGGQAEVEDVLCALLNFLLVQSGQQSQPLIFYSNEWLSGEGASAIASSPFVLSLAKISSMLRDVRIRGFTAFVG